MTSDENKKLRKGHGYNHSMGYATYHSKYPGGNGCNILQIKQFYIHIKQACMHTVMELGCMLVLVTVDD